MADYEGSSATYSPGSGGTGAIAAARERSPRQGVATMLPFPGAVPTPGEVEFVLIGSMPVDHEGSAPNTGPGRNWFETVHFTPEAVSLGNLLSTVVQSVEVYNAYRKTSQTLTSLVISGDPGVSLDNEPPLPYEIFQQSGVVFDLVISIDGPPTIDASLALVTDTDSFTIPITGSRIVTFAYQPETGIVETLEFKTDVLVASDGTEQRIAWRKNPVQQMEMLVRALDDHDRRKMQSLLRGWHDRVFGVPIWWESRTLESDLPVSSTSIPVDTRYADYRAGGFCIVWESPEVWDAVEISAVNANSIDLTSGTLNAYTADEALVMPLRTARLGQQIDMRTFLKNLQDVRLQWVVQDNDVGAGFGDTSPFSSYKSKVMLDGANIASGPIPDGIEREFETLDNGIAPRYQFSDWLSSVPVTQKGFYGGSRQAIWETRRLVHALRGSQVSFYLPTFLEDLEVTQDLVASSTDLNIANIGYTDFVGGVEPYTSIWIELVDGTILTRDVVGSVVVDADNERLTVDTQWASTVNVEDISRVCFLRLVRIADDTVQFFHEYPGVAEITMGVRGAP